MIDQIWYSDGHRRWVEPLAPATICMQTKNHTMHKLPQQSTINKQGTKKSTKMLNLSTVLQQKLIFLRSSTCVYIYICHTAIENLSDPIGYLLDFTNPYYTALAGNMKAPCQER